MRWQDTHYRPTLELLEQRDLPASAVLSSGYLYITSTTHHEFVTVSQNGGRLSVSGTGITVGSSKVSKPRGQVHGNSLFAKAHDRRV